MSYIIRKNDEDYAEQNTDIYSIGNSDYTLENDELLFAICEVVIDDINFVARGECGTPFNNNKEYAFGYAEVERIDEIVDRCVKKATEKLGIPDCEKIITQIGIYKSLEVAREWSCKYRDLRMERDWRKVIYCLIQSQLSFCDWIEDVSVEVFDAIDGDTAETDEE